MPGLAQCRAVAGSSWLVLVGGCAGSAGVYPGSPLLCSRSVPVLGGLSRTGLGWAPSTFGALMAPGASAAALPAVTLLSVRVPGSCWIHPISSSYICISFWNQPILKDAQQNTLSWFSSPQANLPFWVGQKGPCLNKVPQSCWSVLIWTSHH